MARRTNTSGKIGSFLVGILGFFAVILGIVFGVAGIKYVTENDIFGDGTSDPSIITTSDYTTSEDPLTSENPITSEEPITSEIPVTSEQPITSEVPVTSEVPQPVNLSGEFPNPLFDGPYIDYVLSGNTDITINLNPHIKPATISASSYGTHLGTTTKGYYLDNLGNPSTAIDFSINANSIRYDNTKLGYKLGFSDTTLASNITIDPIFYRDQENTAYTYTSVLIYNFSIVNEDGWSFYVDSPSDLPITIYYRTNDDLAWKIGPEEDVNYFGTSSFDLMPGVEMQLAIAFHSNSKSNGIYPNVIQLHMKAVEQPLANEEGIYRIAMYNNNFSEETNYGDGWEVVSSVLTGQYDTHTGISKSNYYYVDIKPINDYPGARMLSFQIYGLVVNNFANIDLNDLQPGVNLLNLTKSPTETEGVWNFNYQFISHRPFYPSDFN